MTIATENFVCYVGRGKTGRAKTGKPRLIFWDTTGTGADHARLDKDLTQIWNRAKENTNLSAKEFRTKCLKEIAGLASMTKCVSDIYEVSFPDGTIMNFRVRPYETLTEQNY